MTAAEKPFSSRRDTIRLLIGDENLRNIIFGADPDFSDKTQYLLYVKNTLYLSIFLAYVKFAHFKKNLESLSSDDRRREISGFSAVMVRLYSMFDSCYSSEKMDFDLVENALLNMQVDDSNGFLSRLGLNKFFNLNALENDLSKTIFLLKQSILSSRFDPKYEFDNMCSFFAAFPFLNQAKVSFYDRSPDGETGIPANKCGLQCAKLTYLGEEIDLKDLMLFINGDPYYLYGIDLTDPKLLEKDKTKTQFITAKYVHLHYSADFSAIFSNTPIADRHEGILYISGGSAVEDLLLQLRAFDIAGLEDKSFFGNFFFINNKYIKNLALVISDSLTIECKNKILWAYSAKYSELFNQFCGSYITRWDEIIIFLLIEVGVYELLTFLFNDNSLDYETVKNAFSKRFGERAKTLSQDYDLIADPSHGLLMRNRNNITHCKVRALILLASSLLSTNKVSFSFPQSLDSIPEVIADLQATLARKIDRDQKVLYAANKLINTNAFIYNFKESALSCYKSFKERTLGKGSEPSVYDGKNPLFTEFYEKTKSIKYPDYFDYTALCDITSIRGKNDFDKLCNQVNASFNMLDALNDRICRRNTVSNEQFYDLTGRRELFDKESFSSLKNAVVSCLSSLQEANGGTADDLYGAIINYLSYLKDGSIASRYVIEDAIAPILGTCSQAVLSQDGFKYYYLSVNFGKDGKAVQIKIISNESLNVGELYYCVPNIKRCLHVPDAEEGKRSIWLNPFIVPYSAYNSNNKYTYETLKDKADYDKTATLIYYADERLNKKLYGDKDTAVEVIKQLFDKSYSVYAKKYVRFIRLADDKNGRGTIIAVATLYDSLPNWEKARAALESCFPQEKRPSSYASAIESVADTFNDSIGNNFYVNDVCVDKEYRRKGFSKLLLNNLFREAGRDRNDKNLVLSVYCENKIALNLYNRMEFIRFVTGHDARGDNYYSSRYYKMIKYL